MPLHADDESSIRHVQGFHQSVLRVRHRDGLRGELFHCLMVIAVHCVRARADDVGEQGALFHIDRVNRPVIRWRHVVLHAGRMLRRQILIEGSAEEGVHQLDATTDTEHRLVLPVAAIEEIGLHLIAATAAHATARFRFLVVDAGIHIVTTRHQDAITERKTGIHLRPIDRQRKHDRKCAAGLEGLHVARKHPVAFLLVIIQRDQPDYLLHTFLPPLLVLVTDMRLS